jgi:acetoacetyl-CoA synthetase
MHYPYDRLFRPTVNFAEKVLSGEDPDAVVLSFGSVARGVEEVTLGTLRAEVDATSRWLRQLRLGRRGLVVGYLPSVPEAVTGLLATAAIGAVWSACSTTLSAHKVAHRYLDFAPAILIAVERLDRDGVAFDRREEVNRLRGLFPHLLGSALVPGTSPNLAGCGGSDRPAFESLDVDHPLLLGVDEDPRSLDWPVVLNHGEAIGIEGDETHSHPREAGSRVLWAVDDAAPHWTLFAQGLAANRSIVLHQGDPGSSDLRALWDLCATTGCTSVVVDHTYIRAAAEAGLRPAREASLDRLESVTVTAPAPVEALADWIGEQVGARCRWSVVAPGRKLDDRRLQRSAAAWI